MAKMASNSSPPTGRWSLYPLSSFKLALAIWLVLTRGTLEYLKHTEKSTCAMRNGFLLLFELQNHHVIQVQASLLQDGRPQGRKSKASQLTASIIHQPWREAMLPHPATGHPTKWPWPDRGESWACDCGHLVGPAQKTCSANPQNYEWNKWQFCQSMVFWGGLLHRKS